MFAGRGVGALRTRGQTTKRESLSAWSVSLVTHLVLLFALSCFIFKDTVREHLLTLNVERPETATPLQLVAAAPNLSDPTLASERSEQPVKIPSMSSVESDLVPLDELAMLEFNTVDEMRETESPPSNPSRPRRRVERPMPWQIREPATTESIRSVPGVVAALGPIEQAIRNEVAQGDTLVVWLMDASISLQLNRRMIAHRLADFQISLGAATKQQGLDSRDSGHLLFNSVVAFGQGVE
jgi:hypothetical protein